MAAAGTVVRFKVEGSTVKVKTFMGGEPGTDDAYRME